MNMKVIKGNFSDKNKMPGKNQKASVIYDEDGNYSLMLLDLIKPYMNVDPAGEELEEMVQLGMFAWNLSISKSLGVPGHNEISKSAIAKAGFDKEQVEIVKKIRRDKQNKFPEHTAFIESYELQEDTDKRMKVMVSCIPLMDMIDLMGEMDIDDDDFDDDDFDSLDDDSQYEEGILNRSAFSLTHKPAFIEWAKKAEFSFKPQENSIFLFEEKESEQQANAWLKKNFKKLMLPELEDVTVDEKKWPKLTYKVFCEFFGIQYYDMIFDTEEMPVTKY